MLTSISPLSASSPIACLARWLRRMLGGLVLDLVRSKTAGEITYRIGDTVVTIRYDHKARRATAHGADGTPLAAVVGYWFAWHAFHPATEVFRAGTVPRQQG